MRRREEHPDPCDHTELPKVIARKSRTLTPEEFEQLVAAVPAQYWLMLDTFIETGMRWGELIALRPRHIDFLRRTVSVEETIVETSKVNSPTGERFIVKPYPKNNEPRTFGVRQAWLDAVAKHVSIVGLGRDDLIFTTKVGTPISRNSFRTHVWLPAVAASGVDFAVRVHDLRHGVPPRPPRRGSEEPRRPRTRHTPRVAKGERSSSTDLSRRASGTIGCCTIPIPCCPRQHE